MCMSQAVHVTHLQLGVSNSSDPNKQMSREDILQIYMLMQNYLISSCMHVRWRHIIFGNGNCLFRAISYLALKTSMLSFANHYIEQSMKVTGLILTHTTYSS